LSTDPLWPLRFLARLPGHWRDKGARRGAQLSGP
jgi:hypothetical protein